jgi:predicted nucleotidyltransferase
MSHKDNLIRIKAVYNALAHLRNDVVFVGGATVSFYVDRMAEEVRPTNDIDILIELWTYKDYTVIEAQLRTIGFENDFEAGVICRYRIQGIVVDIMPTGDQVLGFSNKWYPQEFKKAIDFMIDERVTVKILSVEYFIASKLEAFKGRGKNDGRTSSDFEDIIYVLENRSLVWDEMKNASADIKEYLKSEFKALVANPFFEEWLDANTGFNSPGATAYILNELEDFIKDVTV